MCYCSFIFKATPPPVGLKMKCIKQLHSLFYVFFNKKITLVVLQMYSVDTVVRVMYYYCCFSSYIPQWV